MIKEINEELMDRAIEFAWKLSREDENSSYPIIKDKADFEEGFRRCLTRDEQVLLGYFEDDELIGIFNYFYIEEEKYVQTRTICITKDYDRIMDEFFKFINKRFRGYEVLCGFPKENKNAMEYFTKLGAEVADSCLDMRLKLEDFKPAEDDDHVHLIDVMGFDNYVPFHDKHFGGAYWNSVRVFENFDDWKIYTYEEDNHIKGGLFMKAKTYKDNSLEVFGLDVSEDGKGRGIEKALLSYALKSAINEVDNISEILYFVDDDKEEQLQAEKELGFHYSGSYRSFRIRFR